MSGRLDGARSRARRLTLAGHDDSVTLFPFFLFPPTSCRRFDADQIGVAESENAAPGSLQQYVDVDLKRRIVRVLHVVCIVLDERILSVKALFIQIRGDGVIGVADIGIRTEVLGRLRPGGAEADSGAAV